MSDMDCDEDKENFMPGYAREKNSGVMQNLNDVNDIISISSDSVNDSSDSDKNEIDIREEIKGQQNDKFKKTVDENKNDRMHFINYFTCKTQRVQLKPDTEIIGKKNFGDLLSKTGAQIVPNKKKSK